MFGSGLIRLFHFRNSMTVYRNLIEKKITEAFVHQFEIPKVMITAETNFFRDLNFSVMQFAELTVHLETELDKKIFDRDALRLTTVGAMTEYALNKMIITK